MKRTLWAVLLGTAVLMLACTEDTPPLQPIDAQDATLQLNSHFRHHVEGMSNTMTFLDGSELAVDMAAGLRTDEAACAPDDVCEAPRPSFDLREDATQLADLFEERIFVAGNVEDDSATHVTLLLQPTIVCATEEGPLEEGCVDFLTRVEVRLDVTTRGQGNLDLALFLGPERIHAADLEIYDNHLALDLNLPQVKDALEYLFTTMTEPGESVPPLPQTMSGKLRLELIEGQNTLDYTVALRVLEALHIQAQDTDLELDVNIAKAADLLTLHFDGGGQLVEASMDAGAIDVAVAGALFGAEETCSSGPNGEVFCESSSSFPGERLGLALAGLEGLITLHALEDRLTMTGIGLGSSTSSLSIDGNTIAALDLNADHGRHLDATVTANEDGGATLSFSPALQLDLTLALVHIADQLDDVPAWALDEQLSLLFDGAAPALSLLDTHRGNTTTPVCIPGDVCDPVVEPEPTPQALLSVDSGQLSLSASSASQAVTVNAGQCLITDENASGDHLLDRLASGACP